MSENKREEEEMCFTRNKREEEDRVKR